MRKPRGLRVKKRDRKSARPSLVDDYREWLQAAPFAAETAHVERLGRLTYEQILTELERVTQKRRGRVPDLPAVYVAAFLPAAPYAAAFIVRTQDLLFGTPTDGFTPSASSKRLGARGRAIISRFLFDGDWKRRGAKERTITAAERDVIASRAAQLRQQVSTARRRAGPDRDQLREELRPIVRTVVPAARVEGELRQIVRSNRIDTNRIVAQLLHAEYQSVPQERVLEILRQHTTNSV